MWALIPGVSRVLLERLGAVEVDISAGAHVGCGVDVDGEGER